MITRTFQNNTGDVAKAVTEYKECNIAEQTPQHDTALDSSSVYTLVFDTMKQKSSLFVIFSLDTYMLDG